MNSCRMQLLKLLLRNRIGHRAWLDAPDLLAIVADGAVRRELAHADGGENGASSPAFLVSPVLLYLSLCLEECIEVIADGLGQYVFKYPVNSKYR